MILVLLELFVGVKPKSKKIVDLFAGVVDLPTLLGGEVVVAPSHPTTDSLSPEVTTGVSASGTRTHLKVVGHADGALIELVGTVLIPVPATTEFQGSGNHAGPVMTAFSSFRHLRHSRPARNPRIILGAGLGRD
jgi:hypothetical protein